MLCAPKLIILFKIIGVSLLAKVDAHVSARDSQYAGESDQVLRIIGDLKAEAGHHLPNYYSHPKGVGHGPSHVDRLWTNDGGSHRSDYDNHANRGWKERSLNQHRDFHDRHNDGYDRGNWEEYGDKSLWSRDRGHENERDVTWDKELAIKNARAERAGHDLRYNYLDRGSRDGLSHFDGSGFAAGGERAGHSGHGWHELDSSRQLIGGHDHPVNHYGHSRPQHYHH